MEINSLFDECGVIKPLAIFVVNNAELDMVFKILEGCGLKQSVSVSKPTFPCYVCTHMNGQKNVYSDMSSTGSIERVVLTYNNFLNPHHKSTGLISGTDACFNVINGKEVVWCRKSEPDVWRKYKKSTTFSINDLSNGEILFKLKPSTIMIGDVEVPAPFEPEEGDQYWFIISTSDKGYTSDTTLVLNRQIQYGCWKTEDEIKQVVIALRKLLKI